MPKQNDNLFINVNEVMDLIECMYQSTDNYYEKKAFDEVQNVILDLNWKELKA